jgi:hypothetical protein
MPLRSRLFGDTIACSLRQVRKREDEIVERFGGTLQSRACARSDVGATTLAAVMSWIMTHFIEGFASYAAAMHPVWQPSERVGRHDPTKKPDRVRPGRPR